MNNKVIIQDVSLMRAPPFEGVCVFKYGFTPYDPCYGSFNTARLEDRDLIRSINPIYNSYSTKALGADALPHRRFVSIDLKDQLPEALAACILDGKHRIAEALLAHAPVQEVSYFAELIHRICVNRGVVHSGQNWQLIRHDKLLEFYSSLSPVMKYLNLLGPDGFQASATGIQLY